MKKELKISKLVILDSNAIVHRAYHALPPFTSPQGQIVNAVFGFFTMLLKTIKELEPTHIVATFDLGGETFRHKEFKEYKAQRAETDQELYQQIPIIQDILKTMGISVLAMRGVEADDIIGSISKNIHVSNIIVTGDQDMLQLVDDDTVVYMMKRGMSDTVIYNQEKIQEKFGFGPENITDFKGLKGDPSDNIPGVPGVGDKTAMMLIQNFGDMEKIYEAVNSVKSDITKSILRKLLDNKEQAFFSKKLATIKTDIKLDFELKDFQFDVSDIEKAKDKFLDLGMKSIATRLRSCESYGGQRKIDKTCGAGKNVSQNDTNEKKQKSLFTEQNVQELIEKYFKDGLFSKEIRDLEISVIPVIEEMEKNGIIVDVKKLEVLSKDVTERIKEIEKKIHDFAGSDFNIKSSQQLSEILFDKLKISTKGIGKTPKGILSTAAPELEKIKDRSPIIIFILRYRELEKLRNTYIDALPKLVGEDERIHTKFDQLGTVTGRISSAEPNLQNIPIRSEEGEEIRKAFIPENGFKLFSFDYSQIDLRSMAHISEDKTMVQAFQNGEDIHTKTAMEIFRVKEKDVDTKMRRMAKTINFGVIYGMSSFGLSARAGVSRTEAKDFIERYFKRFSGVAKYIERSKKDAIEKGYVETIFGRKRYVQELQSRNWQIKASGERMAINMPIQGTSADIVKMAMRDVWEWLEKEKLTGDIKMLLQVHDELLFEIKKDVDDKKIQKIKEIMEGVTKLKVPLIVGVKSGDNWGELINLQ